MSSEKPWKGWGTTSALRAAVPRLRHAIANPLHPLLQQMLFSNSNLQYQQYSLPAITSTSNHLPFTMSDCLLTYNLQLIRPDPHLKIRSNLPPTPLRNLATMPCFRVPSASLLSNFLHILFKRHKLRFDTIRLLSKIAHLRSRILQKLTSA